MSQARISLLAELLKTFKERELLAFSKFIESPYFNEDQKLIDLFKKIKRYALGANNFTPALQLKLYEETYSDKPLNQKEITKKQLAFLNNRQHKLLRLVEQFLMIENFKADEDKKSTYLYQTLIDRNQVNLYQRHLKSDIRRLSNESKRGISYYSSQYKLQEANLHFFIKSGIASKEDNFDQLHHYLDINYISEKLNYHLAQLHQKKIYHNKNYVNFSLDPISDLLKMPQYEDNPLIQTYISNINLIESQSDSSYHSLFKTLALNKNRLPKLILRVFYTNLTNYCSAQIKRGNFSYYQNLFDIYKLMYENDLMINYNLMQPGLIKNIVTVSCVVKKFGWANDILEGSKKFIQSNIRESVYYYNKGVISYNKEDFEAAQDWFLKVEKVNETYEIDLRIFFLQCIFEIEKYYNEATKQSFESTKKFFKRNKYLSANNKKSYLNFISIFMYVYQYKHQAIKMQPNKILNKLNKMEVVYKKQWLENKIEELCSG